MSHEDPVTRVISSAGQGEPPPELRGAALARAERAWAEAGAPDRWRRIWESRPLRVAWAAAAIALAAANLAVPSLRGRASAVVPGTVRAIAAAELQDAVSLPRLRAAYAAMDIATIPPGAVPEPAPIRKPRKEARS